MLAYKIHCAKIIMEKSKCKEKPKVFSDYLREWWVTSLIYKKVLTNHQRKISNLCEN